jgi:hypothetical protein
MAGFLVDAVPPIVGRALQVGLALRRGHDPAPHNRLEKMTACKEKSRLTREYKAATEAFSQSVAVLQEKMGVSPKGEYERLQRVSEEWRVHSEQARLPLERHIAAHGC